MAEVYGREDTCTMNMPGPGLPPPGWVSDSEWAANNVQLHVGSKAADELLIVSAVLQARGLQGLGTVGLSNSRMLAQVCSQQSSGLQALNMLTQDVRVGLKLAQDVHHLHQALNKCWDENLVAQEERDAATKSKEVAELQLLQHEQAHRLDMELLRKRADNAQDFLNATIAENLQLNEQLCQALRKKGVPTSQHTVDTQILQPSSMSEETETLQPSSVDEGTQTLPLPDHDHLPSSGTTTRRNSECGVEGLPAAAPLSSKNSITTGQGPALSQKELVEQLRKEMDAGRAGSHESKDSTPSAADYEKLMKGALRVSSRAFNQSKEELSAALREKEVKLNLMHSRCRRLEDNLKILEDQQLAAQDTVPFATLSPCTTPCEQTDGDGDSISPPSAGPRPASRQQRRTDRSSGGASQQRGGWGEGGQKHSVPSPCPGLRRSSTAGGGHSAQGELAVAEAKLVEVGKELLACQAELMARGSALAALHKECAALSEQLAGEQSTAAATAAQLTATINELATSHAELASAQAHLSAAHDSAPLRSSASIGSEQQARLEAQRSQHGQDTALKLQAELEAERELHEGVLDELQQAQARLQDAQQRAATSGRETVVLRDALRVAEAQAAELREAFEGAEASAEVADSTTSIAQNLAQQLQQEATTLRQQLHAALVSKTLQAASPAKRKTSVGSGPQSPARDSPIASTTQAPVLPPKPMGSPTRLGPPNLHTESGTPSPSPIFHSAGGDSTVDASPATNPFNLHLDGDAAVAAVKVELDAMRQRAASAEAQAAMLTDELGAVQARLGTFLAAAHDAVTLELHGLTTKVSGTPPHQTPVATDTCGDQGVDRGQPSKGTPGGGKAARGSALYALAGLLDETALLFGASGVGRTGAADGGLAAASAVRTRMLQGHLEQLLRGSLDKTLPPGELRAATLRAAAAIGLPLAPPQSRTWSEVATHGIPPSCPHTQQPSNDLVAHQAQEQGDGGASSTRHKEDLPGFPPSGNEWEWLQGNSHLEEWGALGQEGSRSGSGDQVEQGQRGYDGSVGPLPDLLAGLDFADWQLAPAEPPPDFN